MYLILSPFFYYIANEPFIHDFIALESNGRPPYHIQKDKLASMIERYISLNSHGVDMNRVEQYITYICEHILQT